MPEKIKRKEPKRYILGGKPRFKIKNNKVKNKKYAHQRIQDGQDKKIYDKERWRNIENQELSTSDLIP